MTTYVAILTPPARSTKIPSPKDRPIGKVAEELSADGIIAVFGNTLYRQSGKLLMDGLSVQNGKWITLNKVPIHAIHDRYPSQIRWQSYNDMMTAKQDTPMGNPFSITMLCRDKIKTQRLLEEYNVPMPPVVSEFTEFQKKLGKWNTAYLKPQFGALGQSVSKVTKNSQLTTVLPSVVPGKSDPAILQRAVLPPTGWAGLSVRILVQRTALSDWVLRPAVLRRSKTDPVVNAARGAEVLPAADALPQFTMTKIKEYAQQTAIALSQTHDGQWAVEFGLDLVIDEHYSPWVIEVNSRPRGRLEALAKLAPRRFAQQHKEACAQPIRFMATAYDCLPTSFNQDPR